MQTPPASNEIVFETPWFKILALHPPGSHQPYYAIQSSDFAVVIALSQQGQLFSCASSCAVWRLHLEPPAGHVEPGETPEEAARKELCEETGHEAGRLELIAKLSPSPARNTNRMWIYFAENVRPSIRPAHPREAGVECVFHTGGVRALLENPEFVAAGGWAAILAAVKRGKLAF